MWVSGVLDAIIVSRVKSDDSSMATKDDFDEVIGVQDQTYRHSWPNSEVSKSILFAL